MSIYEFQNVFNAARELCIELTKDYDVSHDISHHDAVVKHCEIILDGVNDPWIREITLLAAILHDTVDRKYPNAAEKHERVHQFLCDRIFTSADTIMWIIDNMSYTKEVKNGRPTHNNPRILLARNIVSDADKLEAIGAHGITRCLQYTQMANPDIAADQLLEMVVEHCHEKLLRLKDQFIVTSKAKEMAEPLHNEILNFVRTAGIKKE